MTNSEIGRVLAIVQEYTILEEELKMTDAFATQLLEENTRLRKENEKLKEAKTYIRATRKFHDSYNERLLK